MKTYLYRRGDGNEGTFIKAKVALKATDCPYSALVALVANDYRPRHALRRYIIKHIDVYVNVDCGVNIETWRETDLGIHADVYDGPEGETDFGAVWLTSELQPVTDAADAQGATPLRRMLDNAALRLYRRLVRASK